MNKKTLFLKKEGFALITVLFMTCLLAIMTVSLITLTSHTLYRTTNSISRNSILPMADSAISEVVIKLTDDNNWGKNKERLLMRSGNQNMRAGNIDPLNLPSVNSNFTFDEINGYYFVTFDSDDSAFKTGEKFFSVNNLSGDASVPNWRGEPVPPHTADIVITVARDNTVRHVEVLLTGIPVSQSGMTSGARGNVSIKTNRFTLSSVNEGGASPNFHSNYNPSPSREISMGIYNMSGNAVPIMDIEDGACFSACDTISCIKSEPDMFKEMQSPQNIPVIPVSTLVNNITFETETLPSGTYEQKSVTKLLSGIRLEYTSDITGTTRTYSSGDTIVPGVTFEDGKINITKNIKIAYDSEHTNGTGNLTIKEAELVIANGSSLYAPGESYYEPNTGAYNSGNISVSNWHTLFYIFSTALPVVSGNGNIYSMGSINLEGATVESGNTDNIALYSQGDITLNTTEGSDFRGLVYTTGNFHSNNIDPAPIFKCDLNFKDITLGQSSQCGNLTINGALIVAGLKHKV